MRRSLIVIPVLAAATLFSLQIAFPATWGPAEPRWQIVVDYRGNVAALAHGLSEFDCRAALPYGDRQHHVTFSCEREG